MAIIQLDLWKSSEECEIEALRAEVDAVKKSCDKVRKSLFARNGELNKMCIDLQSRLEILERNICRGV